MDKLKILHLINSAGIYGAESVLLDLVTTHRKKNIDSTVACIVSDLNAGNDLVDRLSESSIPVMVFHMARGLDILASLRIIKWAKDNNFTIIHCHGYKDRISMTIIPTLFREIPLVTTLHGWTSGPSISKLKLYEYVDKISIRFFDKIIEVDPARRFSSKMPPDFRKKIILIENGISTRYHTDQNKSLHKLLDIPDTHNIILTIGRLSEEKGYQVLLDGFFRLFKKIKNISLVFIGEGPERSKLESIAGNSNIKNHIHFAGYIPNAYKYIVDSNLVVNTSYTECLPVTLLESMRAKKPVIFSNVGGASIILSGYKEYTLFEPGDGDSLAEKMYMLLTDTDLSNRISEGLHSEFLNKYTSDIMADKYLHAYQGLLL